MLPWLPLARSWRATSLGRSRVPSAGSTDLSPGKFQKFSGEENLAIGWAND
jgi:hypothetical protein